MDNAVLLAAPTTATSRRCPNSAASALGPTVTGLAVRGQRRVGIPIVSLLTKLFFASVSTAVILAQITRICAIQILAFSGFAWRIACRLAWSAWESKPVRRLRKKLFFELAVMALGPGGNTLFVVLFWPGWWFFGLVGAAIWWLAS